MKILAHVHGYPPQQNAGAEWMLHRINTELIKQGIEVRVVVPDMKSQKFQGVDIHREYEQQNRVHYEWADIVISHLGWTGKAINASRFFRVPMIFLVHNPHDYGIVRIRSQGMYVIYNSEWLKEEMKYPQPSIVCRPPVQVKEFTPKPGAAYTHKKDKAITLLNLWEHKGGKVLQEIAKRMPDHKFIGVKGAYGDQEIDTTIKNIEYLENNPEIKTILNKTRILIMPSTTESYGLAAIEAMASRIPVIGTPTPGLKESLGDAGIFCEQDKIDSWVEEITKLDDREPYIAACKKAAKRAKELDPAEDIKKLVQFLKDIKNNEFKLNL